MKKKPLIKKDGEVRELTRSDIRAFRSASEVLPAEVIENLPKRKRGQRGPQKHPAKLSLTVRYSSEVVTYFKSTGEGWQKRMDDALKEWIANHSDAA